MTVVPADRAMPIPVKCLAKPPSLRSEIPQPAGACAPERKPDRYLRAIWSLPGLQMHGVPAHRLCQAFGHAVAGPIAQAFDGFADVGL